MTDRSMEADWHGRDDSPALPIGSDGVAGAMGFAQTEGGETFAGRPGRTPPGLSIGWAGWARANLFSDWLNSGTTLLIGLALLITVPGVLDYLLLNAVWTGTPETCKAAGAGACWAFVVEKARLILFGVYPYDEQWRPALVIVIFVGMIVATATPRCWSRWLILAWVIALATMLELMSGGLPGLELVSTDRWGGLVLTMMLAIFGSVVAFPIGVVLALGRRSQLPVVRTLSVCYIELIRGVPLISLLFMASIMFPLFLPEQVNIDVVLRAQIAIILFIAAYIAEIVRGGLQALPRGQYEAADALGLGYWQKMAFIILPQALKISIPALVSTFIGLFKDTSLVVIIGLFDLMYTTRTAIADAQWSAFFLEAYLFTATIYFAFCFSMATYGRWLEGRLDTGHRR